MTFNEIERQIKLYKHQGKKLLATSSFQTQSVVLLHIISQIDKDIPVYFINTGYLFPETILYKNLLQKKFEINVFDLKPIVPKILQKDNQGNLLFTSDPDYCCFLNKVQPLDAILADYDVWINGVRADQSKIRSKLFVEDFAPHNVVRFHPLINWTKQMIYDYIKEHNFPHHPLEDKGFVSIGCEPCTRKIVTDDERSGRWYGMNKTECGLNTDLIIEK